MENRVVEGSVIRADFSEEEDILNQDVEEKNRR